MLLTRFSSPEIEQIEYQNGLYQHGTPKASMCIMYESIHAVPIPPPSGNPILLPGGRRPMPWTVLLMYATKCATAILVIY